MGILIDVETLAGRLDAGERTVLLDVRWALGDPHGHQHYLDGHLPGAVFVSLDTELAGHGEPSEGRHPLPAEADFAAAMRRWGLDPGDTVVAYDDAGNAAAARLWWLLGHAGWADVRLLDGGLRAWRAAGHALESGEVLPIPGTAGPHFGHRETADIDGTAGWPSHGVLLDARAGERYRGEVEPMDPEAGHIPGALSAPTMANLAPDQRFLPAAKLRERFAALGITGGTDVAVYCGSGVTAAHQIAALEIAGVRAALFPGSWSAWSNTPGRPVAVGEHAAGGRPEGGDRVDA
ncbi:sulfurtransferase [Pseudarthrobacter sp. P1]|uniref:sulfurtransferase n=1 Tax=Pseudarthrobacter sp. P1 TaxID=3418418 RepID=UPI003CEEB83C